MRKELHEMQAKLTELKQKITQEVQVKGVKNGKVIKEEPSSEDSTTIKREPIADIKKEIRTKELQRAKDQGVIEAKYCTTEENVADLMTKPLGPNRMKKLRSLAGL